MPPGAPSVIAVTGATGFIGRQLCLRLLAGGRRVKALARRPAAAAELARGGAQLCFGGLHEPAALAALVEGCDAVIHCAGAVRGAWQRDFTATNVEGTAALLRAVRERSGGARFILLSSVAAMQPQLSWYAGSKRLAERVLAEHGGEVAWTALRPAAVYGPGDRELLPVFRLMAHGLALVPGDPDSRISLLHVHDLVAAIVALLECESAWRRPMTVCDGRRGGYSWRELAAAAASVWRRRVRLLRLPAGIAGLAAAGNLGAARVLGYAPMLTPPKLRELRHPDWVVDNRELERATGWRPRISLRQGLAELAL